MREIAGTLNRSLSTLSDELKRNQVRGAYDPKKAHHKAYVRRKYSKYQGMKIVSHRALRDFVETHLLDDQSPENIVGRVREHEPHLPSVSGDSIYRFLRSPYGRKIEYERERKKRKRGKRRSKQGSLSDRTFIDERPRCIETRSRVGDAEADFVVSGKDGKGILLGVADRKYRTAFLEKILPVTIEAVHQAFLRIKERYPELRTLTTDNDLLLREHKKLEGVLKVRIFFCHPYHSWEKGTIENVNKYIRKEIPKGSDLSRYSKKFIQEVEAKLNRRFMKCLEHRTPQEALERYRSMKKQRSRAGKKGKKKCSD